MSSRAGAGVWPRPLPSPGTEEEANEMAAVEKKSLNQPEETQTPEKAKVETVNVKGVKIQRVTVEPGW